MKGNEGGPDDMDADEESMSEEDSGPGSYVRTPRAQTNPHSTAGLPADKRKPAVPPQARTGTADLRDSKPLIGRPPRALLQASMHVPLVPSFRNFTGAFPGPQVGSKRTFSQSTHDAEHGQDSTGSMSDVGSAGDPGKIFQCPLQSCRKSFKRLEHLKRHVRTHTEERPYECQRCRKRFSRGDNLMQHYKIHDKIPPPPDKIPPPYDKAPGQ